MPTHHSDLEVVAGDLWSIDGQLLDRNGSALDLTNAVIEWSLRDPNGEFMIAAVTATTVSVTDPVNGLINISVPINITAGCEAGRYHDSVRVAVEGSYIDTVWVGLLLVDADPFQVDVSPAPVATAPDQIDIPPITPIIPDSD